VRGISTNRKRCCCEGSRKGHEGGAIRLGKNGDGELQQPQKKREEFETGPKGTVSEYV